jgi:nucleoside 2-deoxyribosyltransferase
MSKIYLIGSLRNPKIPEIAIELRRALGAEVFDDWHSVGPECDDHWQAYEKQRGRGYIAALNGHHARDVFEFDKRHLDACDAAVMVLPAGRSGHLEFGYIRGQGKPGFILLDGEPERYDIMYLFASRVVSSMEELIVRLKAEGR